MNALRPAVDYRPVTKNELARTSVYRMDLHATTALAQRPMLSPISDTTPMNLKALTRETMERQEK